ncbi:RHS repeat-associated core domain-containing protein [Sorangium sp. So ce375]|uniref:RHS repeat-associated core domain-containing protein n=1 Tax=Sorangium sp. So ce375 TaxID=3133306 RepID=UPI003F5C04DE
MKPTRAAPPRRRDPSDGAAAASAAGRIDGAFQVDGSGQAVYSIAIDVPPGIGGLAPRLALTYSHRTPNGILGIGWQLTGLSAITRCKATYAVDGFNGAVEYGADDRLCLDNQRLINVRGAYGEPGAIYRTELETWRLVRASDDPEGGFSVSMKSGDTWGYGETADSRIEALGKDAVRVWALSSITDLNGNRLELSYTADPLGDGRDEGMYYIQRIAYTSHGEDVVANRFVRFEYEARPDVLTRYQGGAPITVRARLKRIITELAGGEIVKTLTLSYVTSGATQDSLLVAIEETGAPSDGAPALPATRLVWQEVIEPGFSQGPTSFLDQHATEIALKGMDVNGDGRTDVVQIWADVNREIHLTTYLATSTEQGVVFERASDTNIGAIPETREFFPMDVSGAGRADLVVAYKDGVTGTIRLKVFLSDGRSFSPIGEYDTGSPWNTNHIGFWAMDVNGDGRSDLVEAYVHQDFSKGPLLYFHCYLSRVGSGGDLFVTTTTATVDPPDTASTIAYWPIDVNGDGMTDLVRVRSLDGGTAVAFTAYIASGPSLDEVTFAEQVETVLPATLSSSTFLPVSANGDGVADLLQLRQEPTADGTRLHLTTFLGTASGAFVAGVDSVFDDESLGDRWFPMDFNGDGRTDIVKQWIQRSPGEDRLMFSVFAATGSGGYVRGPTADAGAPGAKSASFPADVNGDGKADLVRSSRDIDGLTALTPLVSSGPYPNLITAIRDGLGGVIEISYAPISDESVYTEGDRESDAFPRGQGRRFPNPMTPAEFPIQSVFGQALYVVSGYGKHNDPAVNRFDYDHRYALTYEGALVDLTGRGWLGFKSVEEVDLSSGKRKVTIYNQEFPKTGTIAEIRYEADGRTSDDPRVPDDERALLAASFTEYTVYERASGATDPRQRVVEVLKTSFRADHYDYGADHYDYSLGETYDYDAYGNLSKSSYLGYVDRDGKDQGAEDDVYRYFLYENAVRDDGWRLGYVRYAKVSSNVVDEDITRFLPGDLRLERTEYTAGTCNVESSGQWDDGNGVWLETRYTYDDFGHRLTVAVPGGAVTSYEFESDYNTYVARETSPANQQGETLTSYFGYDPRFGAQVAVQDPNGRITLTALDAFGRASANQGPVPPGAVSDANAVTRGVTGLPAAREAFLAATVVTLSTSRWSDDGAGGIFNEVQTLQDFPTGSERDVQWSQRYVDGLARAREVRSQSALPEGVIGVLTDYGPDGQISRQSLPYDVPSGGQRSQAGDLRYVRTQYDVLGRPTRRDYPAGPDGATDAVTTWFYENGRTATITYAAGTEAPYVKVLTFRYCDWDMKVESLVVPTDGDATTTYAYDRLGNMIRAVDPATASNPEGVENAITYDSLNRKRVIDNPDQNVTPSDLGRKAMIWAYDGNTGLLACTTDAADHLTLYDYDALGRVLQRTLWDGTVVSYVYDGAGVLNGAGRLTRVTVKTPDGALESQYDYEYDDYGNTATVTLSLGGEPDPFVSRSVYDPLARIREYTYPDQSVLRRDFAKSRLAEQSLDSARVVYDAYTTLGMPGQVTAGEDAAPRKAIVSTYGYSPAGQLLSQVVAAQGGGSSINIVDLAYEWDLLNQLRRIVDKQPGSIDLSQSYSYESKRLKAATAPTYGALTYEYDGSGNLLLKDGVRFTYEAHRVKSGESAGRPAFAAAYDACGRMRSKISGSDAWTYTYNGLDRIGRIDKEGAGTVKTITYDFQGRRLREIDAAGAVTVYASSLFELTRAADGTTQTTRYIKDQLGVAAAVKRGADGGSATILYFDRDHQRSTRATLDDQGAVQARVVYTPYGRTFSQTGPDDFRPKYEGRELIGTAGIYDFGARYYDPTIGRFVTPDTALGGTSPYQADVFNRFAFELNSPVSFVDPSGHGVADVIAGILVGIAEVIAGIAIDVLSDGALAPLGNALIGGGGNAVVYSATHTGSFSWKQYGIQQGIGLAAGAVLGAAGAGAASESVATGAAEEIEMTSLTGVRAGATAAAEEAPAEGLASAAANGVAAEAPAVAEGAGAATSEAASAAGQRFYNPGEWLRYWGDQGGHTTLNRVPFGGRLAFLNRLGLTRYNPVITNNEAPGTFAFLDTAAHEGTHAFIARNLPFITQAGEATIRGFPIGGSIAYLEEVVAYSVGHVAALRLLALPLVPIEAFGSLTFGQGAVAVGTFVLVGGAIGGGVTAGVLLS